MKSLLQSRLFLLALVMLRIMAGISVFFQPVASPSSSGLPDIILTSALVGWPVAALGLFLFNIPGSRIGYLALLLCDLLFSGCALLRDAPLPALPLILLHGLIWSAMGRRAISRMIPPLYLLMWAGLWLAEPERPDRWFEDHIDIVVDLVRLGPAFATIALVALLYVRRRADLDRLSRDVTIDPLAATGQPFSVDFTNWTDQVTGLFGPRASDCIIGLRTRQGPPQIFSSPPLEHNRATLAQLLEGDMDWVPDRFTVVVDRLHPDHQVADDAASEPLALRHLKHPIVMARHISLGSYPGLAIIAHDIPVDALLQQEIDRIDDALDEVLERASQTIETRRTFLAEAREMARRDLHDGVLQSLAAIRMRLLTTLQNQEIANSSCAGDIRTTADIIALEQARLRMLLESSANDNQAVNLVDTLRLCISTIALQWEVDIDFVTEELAIPMNREAANNVEYLLREIVANATRHSDAKRISCTLAIKDNDLVISLINSSDETPAGEEKKLPSPLESQSLRQRLDLVSGRAYHEGLNKGTLLAISIPLVYEDK